MSDARLQNAIIVTFLLFFATITVGWIGTMQNPEIGENLMKLFQKEVADQISGKEVRIFLSNSF